MAWSTKPITHWLPPRYLALLLETLIIFYALIIRLDPLLGIITVASVQIVLELKLLNNKIN